MKKRKTAFWAAVGMAVIMSMTGCNSGKQTTELLVTPKEEEQAAAGLAGNGQQTGEGIKSNASVSGAENGIAGQVQAPDRYETDFSKGAINVHVDAEVIVPKAAGFKLYKVSGRPFSQEDYNSVKHVLLKDASLWERAYDEMGECNGFIRSEIAAEIAELKEQAAEKGEDSPVTAKDETYEEKIEEWEAMLEAAPEEAPIAVIEDSVPYVQTNNGQKAYEENSLSGYATVDGEEFYVDMDNRWQDNWKWTRFTIESVERGIGDGYINPQKDGNVIPASLSKDEVRQKAAALIEEMGFTDFEPAGEEYFRQYAADEATGEIIEGTVGYGIHFTRTLDGIPVTYTHEMGTAGNGDIIWPYERLDMIFDERGLTDFFWWNPYVLEKQSDDFVFLMPFSDIQDIFEEMILKKYEPLTEGGDITVWFSIDEIRLGYMRIREGEEAQEGTMVPVWDFIGTQCLTYTDGSELAYAFPYESWLTVNAMDGTIIDRDLGY